MNISNNIRTVPSVAAPAAAPTVKKGLIPRQLQVAPRKAVVQRSLAATHPLPSTQVAQVAEASGLLSGIKRAPEEEDVKAKKRFDKYDELYIQIMACISPELPVYTQVKSILDLYNHRKSEFKYNHFIGVLELLVNIHKEQGTPWVCHQLHNTDFVIHLTESLDVSYLDQFEELCYCLSRLGLSSDELTTKFIHLIDSNLDSIDYLKAIRIIFYLNHIQFKNEAIVDLLIQKIKPHLDLIDKDTYAHLLRASGRLSPKNTDLFDENRVINYTSSWKPEFLAQVAQAYRYAEVERRPFFHALEARFRSKDVLFQPEELLSILLAFDSKIREQNYEFIKLICEASLLRLDHFKDQSLSLFLKILRRSLSHDTTFYEIIAAHIFYKRPHVDLQFLSSALHTIVRNGVIYHPLIERTLDLAKNRLDELSNDSFLELLAATAHLELYYGSFMDRLIPRLFSRQDLTLEQLISATYYLLIAQRGAAARELYDQFKNKNHDDFTLGVRNKRAMIDLYFSGTTSIMTPPFAPTSSMGQSEVFSRLKRLYPLYNFELEYTIGPFRLDIASPKNKLFIEYNGPFHYDTYGNLNMVSRFKERCLKKMKWNVITIHYQDWGLRRHDRPDAFLTSLVESTMPSTSNL